MIMPRFKRNQGVAPLLVFLLVVLLLVFIGTLAYVIIKAIRRLERKPSKQEEAALVGDFVATEQAALQAQHPGVTVTVQALGTWYVKLPAFVPFTTLGTSLAAGDYAVIERSTNLVAWELVAVLAEGDSYADTNPPPAMAFYRSRYSDGSDLPADPANQPGFYEVVVPLAPP